MGGVERCWTGRDEHEYTLLYVVCAFRMSEVMR